MKKRYWLYVLPLCLQKQMQAGDKPLIRGSDWTRDDAFDTLEAAVAQMEKNAAKDSWKLWKIEETYEFPMPEWCDFCGRPEAEHSSSRQTCGAYQKPRKDEPKTVRP